MKMKGSGDKICCTFTTYNVLGMVFGILVAGTAGWLAADKVSFFTNLQLHELENEEDKAEVEAFKNISVIDYGAFVLVGVGVAIIIQSLLGCIATCLGCSYNRKARCCLLTYGWSGAVAIILEIVAAVLVLHVYQGHIKSETETFMLKTIQKDYKTSSQGEPNGVTVVWDHIMTSLQCCGVNNFQDFRKDPPAETFEIPLACCGAKIADSSNSTESSSNSTESITSCPDAKDPNAQMMNGCYQILLDHGIPAIASSLAVVAVFQVAGVILACCLSRIMKEDRRNNHYEMTHY